MKVVVVVLVAAAVVVVVVVKVLKVMLVVGVEVVVVVLVVFGLVEDIIVVVEDVIVVVEDIVIVVEDVVAGSRHHVNLGSPLQLPSSSSSGQSATPSQTFASGTHVISSLQQNFWVKVDVSSVVVPEIKVVKVMLVVGVEVLADVIVVVAVDVVVVVEGIDVVVEVLVVDSRHHVNLSALSPLQLSSSSPLGQSVFPSQTCASGTHVILSLQQNFWVKVVKESVPVRDGAPVKVPVVDGAPDEVPVVDGAPDEVPV